MTTKKESRLERLREALFALLKDRRSFGSTTLELQAKKAGVSLDDAPDLVIGNPPYTLATEFAWKAAQWAAEHDTVAAMLLRLSFLEPASGRAVLFDRNPPDVLILPRRPAFDGRGTDSITSAWFCWPGRGQLVWLPP